MTMRADISLYDICSSGVLIMTVSQRLFVWLGGTIFVAALVVFAASYLFVFGRPAAFAGWTAVAIDAALFTVFALHHSLFARDSVKRRLAAIPPNLRRSVYVWCASLLLIAVCLAWRTIGGTLYDQHGSAAVLHAAVQLIGVWIIARSVGRLDPLELAGIREEKQGEPLQIGGPYRLVRHPLYLGWMLALFGAAHMSGDRLGIAAISSTYLLVAVPWEERSLRQAFGDEYAAYARRVRWRVIPFVY
jgi:protein-S-isoprenylcysteine O-methyltransferase Ste14